MNRRNFFGGIAALCLSPTLPANPIDRAGSVLSASAEALSASAAALTCSGLLAKQIDAWRGWYFFDYEIPKEWHDAPC